MSKTLWYLSIFFAGITLVGVGYTLYMRENVNVFWLAIAPMLISMVCQGIYRTELGKFQRAEEEANRKKKKKKQ